jgi:hypothetical protein
LQDAIYRQPKPVRVALQANGQALLAMRLIYERRIGADSKWAEYLALLPFDRPPPLSVFINPSLLNLAGSPDFIKETNDFRSSLTNVFSAMQMTILKDEETPAVLRTPAVSYSEFVNAWAIVASRSFGVRERRQRGSTPAYTAVTAVMVPFADFAQHSADACFDVHTIARDASEIEKAFFRKHGAVKNDDDDDGDFRILSLRNYDIGDDVSVCYDHFANNERLLLHYGFTMDENPQEYVRIMTVLQPTTATFASSVVFGNNTRLHARRKDLLRSLDLPLSCTLTQRNLGLSNNCSLAIRISRIPMEHLLESLRVVCGRGNSRQLLPLLDKVIMDCPKSVLIQALTRVAQSFVPMNEVVASVIGQLLSREKALSAKALASAMGGPRIKREQDLRDIQNLRRVRVSQLGLLYAALKHQVSAFAKVFGVPNMQNLEIDRLIAVLHALDLGEKDRRSPVTYTPVETHRQRRILRYIDERSNMAYLGDLNGRTWWDPERWTRTMDASTHRMYYFSRVLGESRWALPQPSAN